MQSDQAQAEEDSAHVERVLLHRAIASSQNGITIGRVSNGQFPLIYANRAFYHLTGYGPAEVIGNDCRFLQGRLTRQPGLETLRAALAQTREATVLLRNFRKDGTEFWNELTVSPVLGDNGVLTHYVGIQHDVTERENNAQAVRALNQSLARQAEELALANESLRSFSSSASHDLRAPLSSIKGFCAALKKSADMPQGGRSAHYLGRIESNAERMGQLIEALLKLAQSNTGALQVVECNLSAMAREVVDGFKRASPELAATVHIEPGLTALGDASLLYSVLQNLLGNALKYSSKTPDATVHFGREVSSAGQARFFVRDNGEGFDMKAAAKLFGAFERFHSESDFPGTGLGLATVRRIVMRHGGAVTAESAPGEGAVFYFTLETPPAS
ncbi:MAG: sensor signal transduction histidine kinase [Polaromonas sp.]|nr:sensor signal transduction histidine kinase [Polaromonas sp.]